MTFENRGVTDIVCIGDLIDSYNSSKYTVDPMFAGISEEYRKAKKFVKELSNEFPVMRYVLGNHCNRINKRAIEIGIPTEFLKSLKELYEFPDTWTVGNYCVINKVYYTHGEGVSGYTGAWNMMKAKRMSVVIGHTHTGAGVQYSNNGLETVFALNVGCLIDIKSKAFAYGKDLKEQPVLGCGVVYNSSYAEFIPMVVK